MPGPPPKRSEERRRRNQPAVPTIKVDLDEALAGDVEIPAPPMRYFDEDGEELAEPEHVWQPTAELWYRSLAKSGQAIFYEPSDWASAYMVAEQISLALEPRPVVIGEIGGEPVIRTMVVPMPGATLNAILKANSSLMASEGDRRRLHIELNRKRLQDQALAGEGKVVSISQNRQSRFSKEAQK